MNKDRRSPEQNYVNKRSPLVLHEEPNAQEIRPHRYLTFINHTGRKNLLDLARARGLPAQ